MTFQWQVSILKFQDKDGAKFKVTRRLVALSIAETRIFKDKKKAEKQFLEWLGQT